MTGQEQIADERIFELAMRQAFFCFITYDQTLARGWWWKGMFAQCLAVSKPDLGNDLSLALMQKTMNWDQRVLAITAEERFKLAIRKHLIQDVWSLAVEWNESFRVLAACGDETPLRAFRALSFKRYQSSDSWLAIRTEKALKDEDDSLFVQTGVGEK